MDFRKGIEDALKKALKKDVELETPPDPKLGDFAFPCFSLAKEMKKSPVDIAKDLAKKLKIKSVEDIKATGPYVNFFVDKKILAESVLQTIQKDKDKYGKGNFGKERS